MPEGDTIWRTARRLHEALAGEVLVQSDFRVPKLATVDLAGRRVLEVVPRGKHLLSRIEGGLTLHSHLRMDGSWQLYAPGARWGGGPAYEVRAVLRTPARVAVGYRLPVLDLLRTTEEDRVVGHLGPDPLGPDWDPTEALRRLLSDPERPLADALLDQRVIAGLGNVFVCEVCFLLRRSPWSPVGDVRHPERLVDAGARLLRANARRAHRVTTARITRSDTRLWVYGRAGRSCLRCGTAVRRVERGPGGTPRVTYWCPSCQTGPAPEPHGPGDR